MKVAPFYYYTNLFLSLLSTWYYFSFILHTFSRLIDEIIPKYYPYNTRLFMSSLFHLISPLCHGYLNDLSWNLAFDEKQNIYHDIFNNTNCI